jgi:hypothetical protein
MVYLGLPIKKCGSFHGYVSHNQMRHAPFPMMDLMVLAKNLGQCTSPPSPRLDSLVVKPGNGKSPHIFRSHWDFAGEIIHLNGRMFHWYVWWNRRLAPFSMKNVLHLFGGWKYREFEEWSASVKMFHLYVRLLEGITWQMAQIAENAADIPCHNYKL